MRIGLSVILLFAFAGAAYAQEAGPSPKLANPTSDLHANTPVRTAAPLPTAQAEVAAPGVEAEDGERAVAERRSAADEAASRQEPGSRRWWWLVAAIVLAGVIVAVIT